MLEGRIGPGNDVMGSRTTDEDYVSLRKSLKKRVLDYFKQDFWADTAAFTAVPATKAGMEFFPIDKMDWTKQEREQVYYKNLERITGKVFVK